MAAMAEYCTFEYQEHVHLLIFFKIPLGFGASVVLQTTLIALLASVDSKCFPVKLPITI